MYNTELYNGQSKFFCSLLINFILEQWLNAILDGCCIKIAFMLLVISFICSTSILNSAFLLILILD